MGWLFFEDPPYSPGDKAEDLKRDILLRQQQRFYIPIAVAAGFALPLAAGFMLGDPWGCLIMGGFLRLMIVYHATFSVNSVAHTIGSQPYSDSDSSRDSAITALVTMGEGYHNFHHAFPFDYRNGVRPWHFDPGKWMIYSLSFTGMAKDIVRVPNEVILKSRLKMQAHRAELQLAHNPQVVEILRAAWKRLEMLLDRIVALKAQFAELRARIDRASREMTEPLRREIADTRRRFRQAYGEWLALIRTPELIGA